MGRRPRYSTRIDGLLVVDKPVGCGSTEVVRRVRHLAGNCKTGHAGTLDPLASGVLICCLGQATKQVEQIMTWTKVYSARIDLSAFTATDDAEGERQEIAVQEVPDERRVAEVLKGFLGEIQQVPPVYSACKIGGKAAYARARAGEDVQLAAKQVRIDELCLDDYEWPWLDVTVCCGRGTYIRSLARDIGRALGCGGHLLMLRRLAVGQCSVDNAVPFDQLPDPIVQEHLRWEG